MKKIDRLLMQAGKRDEFVSVAFISIKGERWMASCHLWNGVAYPNGRVERVESLHDTREGAEAEVNRLCGEYPSDFETAIIIMQDWSSVPLEDDPNVVLPPLPLVATLQEPATPTPEELQRQEREKEAQAMMAVARANKSLIANIEPIEVRRSDRRYGLCQDESS